MRKPVVYKPQTLVNKLIKSIVKGILTLDNVHPFFRSYIASSDVIGLNREV